jgi:tRNA-dihydrouridine synthase
MLLARRLAKHKSGLSRGAPEFFNTLLMKNPFEDLRNGVVLAELGGHGDGHYCARHGAGGALVVLGTYIVDPSDDVPYPRPFVFKPGRNHYDHYLKEHIRAARESQAKVGVSVVSIDMKDTLEFLRSAEEAGADYASYCAHSVMEMFTSRNLSSALCRRDQWSHLRKWARAILETVHIPVIFKIGIETTAEEAIGAVEVLVDSGVPAIHINVERTCPGSEELAILPILKARCPCLICGGGISDIEGAWRVLDEGADAVAIGTAAMKDPRLIGRIQKALRDRTTEWENPPHR